MEILTPVEPPRSPTPISYAQNMEDVLLDRLFRARTGTFLDVGGNHPFIDNNTYYFYLRGWRGVTLEPTRRGHSLFAQHRPEDRNLAVAASDEEGEMPFFEIDGPDGLSGLSTLSAEVAEVHRLQGFSVAERRVPVRTVAGLIDEYRIEPPDLMSIDVEGHEGKVLAGIPWATWRPGVLVVESTIPLSGEPSHHGWEPTLLQHGYVFATFNGVNRFYLREDLAEARPLFQVPVSILDGFLRHDLVEAQNRAAMYRERSESERAARAFDQARFEELRQAWEWGKVQAQHAQAVWEKECASFAQERVTWKEALEFFERAQTDWNEARHGLELRESESARARAQLEQAKADLEAQRADWERQRARFEREREEHHAQLAAALTQLRPYQLLDRLQVVPKGYGWARRVKRSLAS